MKYRKLLLALALGCAALGFGGNACAAEPAVTPAKARSAETGADKELPAFLEAQLDDFLRKKDYEGCFTLLAKEIEKDPGNERLYLMRGGIYRAIGNIEGAVADGEQLLRLAPDSETTHVFLMDTLTLAGRYEEALAECDTVEKWMRLEHATDLAIDSFVGMAKREIYIRRGLEKLNDKKWAAALSDSEHVLAINPDDWRAYWIQQKAYEGIGNDEAFERIACRLAASWFDNVHDSLKAGMCYAKIGLYEKAAERYTRALKNSPNDWELLMNRGIMYTNQEKYEDALSDFNRAYEMHPSTAILNNRGEMYRKAKHYEMSRADLEAAYRRNPEDAALLDSLGMLEYATGHYEKAIACFNLSIEKLHHPNSYEYRGKSYAALGKNKEAARDEKLAAEEKRKNSKRGAEKAKVAFGEIIEGYGQWLELSYPRRSQKADETEVGMV